MATTTNYGWTTPDDTALVKDGAAAIRTLGTSVDTTTKNLNPSTTLGDIEYCSSSANVNTRLGIGSTGNVLTVAGGVPTWAAPVAGGAYTELATGTLSGTSVTISSINQTYKHLYLQVINAKATSGFIGLRINGSSSALYGYNRIELTDTSALQTSGATQINVGGSDLNTTSDRQHTFFIENYAETCFKPITIKYATNMSPARTAQGYGSFDDSTAYTSLTIVNTDGVSYTSGDYKLFGVK
jgi:hypothetical protein